MTESPAHREEPISRRRRVDGVGDEFERRYQAGKQPRIEEFLERAGPADRPHLLRELLRLELEFRRGDGQAVDPQEYRDRFAAEAEVVEAILASFAGRGLTAGAERSRSQEDGKILGWARVGPSPPRRCKAASLVSRCLRSRQTAKAGDEGSSGCMTNPKNLPVFPPSCCLVLAR